MAAPKGNEFGKRPEAQVFGKTISLRARAFQVDRWDAAIKFIGMTNRSEWIADTLDKEAERLLTSEAVTEKGES